MAEYENPFRDKSILYILGAGASANAIPTVKDFQERLELLTCALFFADWTIDSETFEKVWGTKQLVSNLSDKPIDDTVYFLNQQYVVSKDLNGMSSIDTLAKNYYLQMKLMGKQFSYIKSVIKNLIRFEQSNHSTRLNELFTFLRSEASNNSLESMIANLNMLNANYLRENKELVKYLNDLKDKLVSKYFDANPKLSTENYRSYSLDQRYVNFLLNIINHSSDRHKKIHIVSWNYDTQFELAAEELNLPNANNAVWQDLKNNMHKLNGDINSGIKFAFENADGDTSIADEIITKWQLQDVTFTDIVVVGYSFPFYNRFIDSRILNSDRFIGIPNIYICEPDTTGFDSVKTSITSIVNPSSRLSIAIKNQCVYHRPDPKNFFIPFSF